MQSAYWEISKCYSSPPNFNGSQLSEEQVCFLSPTWSPPTAQPLPPLLPEPLHICSGCCISLVNPSSSCLLFEIWSTSQDPEKNKIKFSSNRQACPPTPRPYPNLLKFPSKRRSREPRRNLPLFRSEFEKFSQTL